MTEKTMDEMGSPAVAPAKGGLRRRQWFWGILLVLVGLPPLGFLAASRWANQTSIPPDLAELSPDWASAREGAPELPWGSASASSNSLPGSAPSPATEIPAPPPPGATRTGDGFHPDPIVALEAEMRDRPVDDGLRLYLDLWQHIGTDKAWSTWKFNNLFGQESVKPWRPGMPLPRGAADWLAAHEYVINALLRLAENPGLPVHFWNSVTPEPELNPAQSYGNRGSVLSLGHQVLVAEGQRCFEAGDRAGAVRAWRAVVRLAMDDGANVLPMGREDSRRVVASALDKAVCCLSACVGEDDCPAEALGDLRDALSKAHRCVFPDAWITSERQLVYPAWRSTMVAEVNASPWSTPTFGWDAGPYPWLNYPGEYWASVQRFEIPRLDRLGATALRAMRCKRDAPGKLRQCDRLQMEIVRRGRMTWPELLQAGLPPGPQETQPQSDFPYGELATNESVDSYDRSHEFVLAAEARLNLLRAAIEWRLAPANAKPDPSATTVNDRESPWRDPFAEAPLRATVLPDGGVLLYSLGPDLKDQQGRIDYQPAYHIQEGSSAVYLWESQSRSGPLRSGRSIGAGDIALELKR